MSRIANNLKGFLEHVPGQGTPIPPSLHVHEHADIPRGTQVSGPEEDVDLVAFEPVSGLVTRELRPSTGSTFTCHAFSKDGDLLVTGESNGTLRLWNTSDYQCSTHWPQVFGHPISAVNFFKGDSSHVIAVDKSGSLCDFFITSDALGDTSRRAMIQPTKIQHQVGFDEGLGDHPEALMHQFSSDGDVLISTSHKIDGSGSGDTVVNVVKIVNSRCNVGTITLKDASTCVSILSKNGKSLLLLCPTAQGSDSPNSEREVNRCNGIWLFPELDPQSPAHSKRRVPGERATWGRMGEYLLVCSMQKESPKLEVYKTKHFMTHKSRDPYPMAERKLTHGLTRWMARMFDEQADDSSVKVMICESGEDRNIFSVWDVEQDVLTKEVKMTLSPGRTLAENMPPLVKKKTLRSRSRHPPSPGNDFIKDVLWNEFPDVCCAADKNWFGAVSWLYQTINLSSASSGVTAWVSDFANELVERPLSMPSEVMFDPAQNHLILFGEHVIQAFAPSFLDEHFKVGRYIEELDQKLTFMDDEERCANLLDAYRLLPSKALARAWEIGMSARTRSLAWFRHRWEVYRGETVIDAGLSDDGRLLALILRDFRGSLCASVRTAGFTASQKQDDREEVQFPIKVEWRDRKFSPERVFLFRTEDEEDCLAFVSTEEDPVAVFSSVHGGGHEVVHLSMTTCLKICKKAEASNVPLLDNDGVCFLSLLERRIVNRVPYKADLAGLMDDVQGALKWHAGHRKGGKELPQDCGISTDGRLVLLSWDVKNKRSIVVTPTMQQAECRINIQASSKNLSEFCSLSPTGEFTAFLDMDNLSQGRLTVGIFSKSTQRVIFHVDVDRNLPEDMSSECLQKVLTNVFYGFAEDETKLIVNTVAVSPFSRSYSSTPETSAWFRPVLGRNFGLQRSETGGLSSAPLLKDRLNVFRIHRDTRCVPNQDLLCLVKGTTDEVLVETLRMSLGVSMFNYPLATNLTMFQDAFLSKKAEIESRIKELAEKQGVKLALEWEVSRKETPPAGRVPDRTVSTRGYTFRREGLRTRCLQLKTAARESTDLLKKSLEKNCTNEIQDAVELVCSDVAPFTSSAKIIKGSFQELICKEFHLLEEMLSTNKLLHEVRELEVHVGFLDPDLRRDKAIHMITSDSYLEWSEPSSQNILNELWRRKSPRVVEGLEAGGNTSTKKASLMFVRIEDVAKTGMQGIIRPLLFRHVPLHFYQYRVVRWVVRYKWMTIGRHRFIRQGVCYTVFLIVFTVYAWLLASTSNFSDSSLWLKATSSSFLALASAFGWYMAWEEFLQMITYCIEGRHDQSMNKFRLPYFFTIKWNWVDMFSCLMLVILIPVFHGLAYFYSDVGKVLSIFVALEAITAYVKIWCFAQPLQTFGSLVQMVGDIIRDCIAFLVLGVAVMVGFAVAFHVLFRHAAEGGQLHNPSDNDPDPESVFGTLHDSILTLFCALLGEFEFEVYRSSGSSLSWLTVPIFIVYMVIQMVIMLNFLISIMGDTFNRVKDVEEAEFLKGCAEFIDACEASLNQTQRDKIDKEIGKYLIVVSDPDKPHPDIAPSTKPWMGKLKKIETFCTNAVEKSVKNVQEWTEKILLQRIKELERKLDGGMRQQERLETVESTSEQGGRLERLGSISEQSGRLETIGRRIEQQDERFDSLERKIEQLHGRLEHIVDLLGSLRD